MENKGIEVKKLRKEFVENRKAKGFLHAKEIVTKVAVRDIDLSIAKGEKIAVIGPNGAGKSTTIKMITGIIQPTSGEISVMGYSPAKDRIALSPHIGCLFGQKSGLSMHLCAKDSYRVVGAMYDLYGKELQYRIEELSELFDAKTILDIPVKKLSLGQRMKAEIILSLLHHPNILFLDEPTIGLDVKSKRKIREVINLLHKEEKITVFLTSHDMSDVEKLCDRIVIIDQGSIVLDYTMEELKKTYMTKRIIQATFSEPIERIVKSNNRLKAKEENVLTIEVDTFKESVPETLKWIGELGEVVDFIVEGTPLEELIAKIYEQDTSRRIS